jgi:acyl dehydratase/NAD(P)-dependent dehydrogenase (short-subunit alcohol dehydrogenase family)
VSEIVVSETRVPMEASPSASFEVDVPLESIRAFAELSGDWNPLHTDPDYAQHTEFGRQVLHGAFSAGLLSRLAGMYIPGTDCVLNAMRLRFVAPIRPPARLRVQGDLVSLESDHGKVDVTISDALTGLRYVDGAYEFGRHRTTETARHAPMAKTRGDLASDLVLVTGASGGLGAALMAKLGARGVGLTRESREGAISMDALDRLDAELDGRRVNAIVHCGWPAPDNSRLIDLSDSQTAVGYNVGAPLEQSIALARALSRFGQPDAMLVLVGSTAALPGRHAYRSPLYTLSKTLVPELARILALELAGSGMRCAAVVFDVIEAGMNAHLAPRARLAHVDRSPAGRLPTGAEAAEQVCWLLDNRSFLVSGATITLTGAALP